MSNREALIGKAITDLWRSGILNIKYGTLTVKQAYVKVMDYTENNGIVLVNFIIQTEDGHKEKELELSKFKEEIKEMLEEYFEDYSNIQINHEISENKIKGYIPEIEDYIKYTESGQELRVLYTKENIRYAIVIEKDSKGLLSYAIKRVGKNNNIVSVYRARSLLNRYILGKLLGDIKGDIEYYSADREKLEFKGKNKGWVVQTERDEETEITEEETPVTEEETPVTEEETPVTEEETPVTEEETPVTEEETPVTEEETPVTEEETPVTEEETQDEVENTQNSISSEINNTVDCGDSSDTQQSKNIEEVERIEADTKDEFDVTKEFGNVLSERPSEQNNTDSVENVNVEKSNDNDNDRTLVDFNAKQGEEEEFIKRKALENPRETVKINPRQGCELCNYTGYVTDGLGIKTVCSCRIREQYQPRVIKDTTPKVKILDKELLDAVIPNKYKEVEFSYDFCRTKVAEMARIQNCTVHNFEGYMQTLSSILAKLATGTLEQSFILGAPNGFGKASFVYTAMKRVLGRGGKVVPFMSLTELARYKVDYEKNLIECLRYNKKYSKSEEQRFDWSDFMDADVLFTYISPNDKELETMILYNIMGVRGNKGKPTIVMTSESLYRFTTDSHLKERYWDNMLAYLREDMTSVDRLIHKSCFKKYNNSIMQVQKGVDF